MKERLSGIGLAVGAALTLGMVWADSAQAFSLNSTVIVENLLRDPNDPNLETRDISFQGPTTVVVSQDLSKLLNRSPGESSGGNKPGINISPNETDQSPELLQFGGIWDIDLGDNFIAFDLNSVFGNVESGDDVYRFYAPKFGKSGQKIVTDFTVTTLGSFAFRIPPIVNLTDGNEIEVIFPLEFVFPTLGPNETRDPNAPNLTTVDLGVRIDLITEPIPIPTPALLPGLVGMGLAAWRRRRGGDQDD